LKNTKKCSVIQKQTIQRFNFSIDWHVLYILE